jgi:hypothetical protein
MIAALLLATLTAAPGRPPAPGAEPAHAAAEPALLRAAYPDHDQRSGFLGHHEGVLVGRSSACLDDGTCFLAVAASDHRDGRDAASAHAWSTFFAFRAARGGWLEVGHAAGPVLDASGRWAYGVAVLVDGDGPFVSVSTSTGGGANGDGAATHLWSWDGKRFLPVLAAVTGRQGSAESEASFALCADRPSDRPSWELRTRERRGPGKWTESKARVAWNGQAWTERAADKACVERSAPAAVAAPSSRPAAAATLASRPPALLKVKSATASRPPLATRGTPQAGGATGAVDGDRQTAWVPGGKKGGVGEWLQVDLAAPAAIGAVQLLGTCPGADWKAAPRLKKVRLRFEDGPAQEETLADSQAVQSIAVKRKGPARWVRIEILELHAGSRRPDACLTEVTLLGR